MGYRPSLNTNSLLPEALVAAIRGALKLELQRYGSVRAMARDTGIAASTISWLTTEQLKTSGRGVQRPKNRWLSAKLKSALLQARGISPRTKLLIKQLDTPGQHPIWPTDYLSKHLVLNLDS